MAQQSLRHDDFDTKNTFWTIRFDAYKKVPFIFNALFDFDGIPESISILPHSNFAVIARISVVVFFFFFNSIFLAPHNCYKFYLFTLFANWLRYSVRTHDSRTKKIY